MKNEDVYVLQEPYFLEKKSAISSFFYLHLMLIYH